MTNCRESVLVLLKRTDIAERVPTVFSKHERDKSKAGRTGIGQDRHPQKKKIKNCNRLNDCANIWC